MKHCIVLGTRPEIIKFSPLIKRMKKEKWDFFIVNTNQHFDKNLNANFIKQLGIPKPKYNLGIGKKAKTSFEQFPMALQELHKVFKKEKPDIVFVQGDTNSVLWGALAAHKMGIKIAHIEAGLRSHDKRMSEEHNRVLTDHISDYLFCQTKQARDNALMENISLDKIFVVGNTVTDALDNNVPIAMAASMILAELKLKNRKFALLTMHRQENVDNKETLKRLLTVVNKFSKSKKLKIVYPIHPRAEKMVEKFKLRHLLKNILVIKPVDYWDALKLMINCRVLLTDSGSMQEEACILQVPCVTLRDNTERPETIECGANALAGTTDSNKILSTMCSSRKTGWISPYPENPSQTIMETITMEQTTESIHKPKKEKEAFIIFAGVPMDDCGGGQRCSQIAQECLRRGHEVVYINMFRKHELEAADIDYSHPKLKCFDMQEFAKGQHGAWSGQLTPKHITDNIYQALVPYRGKAVALMELPINHFYSCYPLLKALDIPIIYDEIDDWDSSLGSGWYNASIHEQMVKDADLLIATTKDLQTNLQKHTKEKVHLIPNAVNTQIFGKDKSYATPADIVKGERTVGYVGSLWGDWFDWVWINSIAKKHPDWEFNFIGESSRVQDKVKQKNIHLLGLKAQRELPKYLQAFNVCIIPFKNSKLVQAISPLKVYEYLAEYKPVVTTDMKELKGMPGVKLAKTEKEFENYIKNYKKIKIDKEKVREFIGKNSWNARIGKLRNLCGKHYEKSFSIVILTWNNIDTIARVLEGIRKHTSQLYEIIVVDNGSTDGTYEYLRKQADIKIIRNAYNAGCSTGRNQGLEVATGDYIVFLDSDQMVNKYWLDTAIKIFDTEPNVGAISWAAGWMTLDRLTVALQDMPSAGMLGRFSNSDYREDVAYLGTGGLITTRKIAFEVGGFDTFYNPTTFEDTDFSFKIKEKGYRILYCPKIYLIHEPHGSIKKIKDYMGIFTRNKEYFYKKWKKHPEYFFSNERER